MTVADALQRLITEALDSGNELTWVRLKSFSYWGAQVSLIE